MTEDAFTGVGMAGAKPKTLSGRIVLERYNLIDRDPAYRETDERIIQHFQRTQKLLLPKGLAAVAG